LGRLIVRLSRIFVPLFLALAAALPAGAQLAPTFAAPTTYATGAGVGRVATADFNGDGRLDMAVINESDATITILHGDGAGGFSIATTFSGGTLPIALVAGDFNGDGRPDLAVLEAGDCEIRVHLRNAAGTAFDPPAIYPLLGPGVGLAQGDFDNNGTIDLAAVYLFPSDIAILMGNGDGTFTQTPSDVPGELGVTMKIASADFNGDNRSDLVVSVADRLLVYLSNGDGTFASPAPYLFGIACAFAVGDFNGDGRPDIAAIDEDSPGTIIIFLNTGVGGVLAAQAPFAAPGADELVAADFNGDGYDDLAVAFSGTVSLFVADTAGNGTLTASTNLSVEAFYMATADFNADTQPDLAISETLSTDLLSVWINTTLAVPGAPTGVTATAGDAQVSVSFTAPADGGSPILDYTATCMPGPVTATNAVSPIVVAGLTNGTAYACTVHARNAIGDGPESLASNSATPQAVSVVAVASSGSPSDAGTAVTFTATVTGSAPTGAIDFRADAVTLTGCGAVPLAGGTAQCIATFNTVGTRAITAHYGGDAANTAGVGTLAGGQVVVAPTLALAPATLPAGVVLTPYAATITATGGTAPHTFAVSAGALPGGIVLAPGGGLSGAPAATGTFNFTVTATDSLTFTGSRAYTIAVASAGQTITFAPLANLPFGSPAFTVSATGGASGNPVTFASQTPTICTASGTNGTTVTLIAAGACTIRASQAGDATYAAAGDIDRTFNVTAVVPQAPVIGTATGGSGQASIAFTAPSNTGGSPILDYTATCTPGPVSATGGASPIVVNGLTNGITYSCTVTARNAAGTSAPSGAVTVTPNLRTFTGPTATGSGNATVSFTGGGGGCSFAPQGNGALQSAFFIPVSGHPKSPPAGTAPAEFPHGLLDFVLVGCTPGATMAFTVTYPAALPAGTRYWKYGPTASNTAPHWYQLAATITGNTATFSIVDGGMGDDDLAANGTVVDQGGPGLPPVPPELRQVPTLSTWAMMLLAALLLVAAMRNGNFRRDR
jgi:VCBS repeat protein/putative Ig domain-containing protein/fibronectin type III domain protein/exosortase sorting signal-containing protein